MQILIHLNFSGKAFEHSSVALHSLLKKNQWKKWTNCGNFIKSWRDSRMSNLIKFTEHSKLIKFDWLPGFTSQQRVQLKNGSEKYVNRAVALDVKKEKRKLFLCLTSDWENKFNGRSIEGKELESVALMANIFCCFQIIMQATKKSWVAQLEPSPTKEKNKFRIFRVHEQTKNKNNWTFIESQKKMYFFLFFFTEGKLMNIFFLFSCRLLRHWDHKQLKTIHLSAMF